MKVAIIDGDISYPPTSGKRLRTLNLMLSLAKDHSITYLGRGAANTVEMRQAPVYLRDHGIEPILLDCPITKKSGPVFYAKLAANLLSRDPYSVASHQAAKFKSEVTRLAESRLIDLWQFEWTGYVPALEPRFAGARLVCAHNVDTLIWQRYAQTERRPLHRWYLEQQHRKFEAFERRAFHEVDRVVAVSRDDADIIAADFAQPIVDVVDNGVDVAHFSAPLPGMPRREANTILYLGALDWRPNLDAIGVLLESVLPEVQRHIAGAKLWIVGRNPPAALEKRIERLAGVTLMANVPDVRPYLARASVLAVPLRIGGGSRLKILEALAAKLPVVSSSVGAEGLELTAGRHYVRSDEDSMANALVEALSEPERMQALAEAGFEQIRMRYDWQALGAKLQASWEACVRDHRAKLPFNHRSIAGRY